MNREEFKKIRNFVIISHIDHGKSTLADRFLEITGAVSSKKMKPQFLDMMDLERERGITIKLQPVRMEYNGYILNLIDTPGHVDFSYEVSRSLAAVEGAILLVDAVKGIQAQTLANLALAKEQNLVIVPAVNKIDLPQAMTEEVAQDLANLLKIDESEVIRISAKKGTNVKELLEKAILKIPPTNRENVKNPFRALIFDSKYNSYKGIIAYVRIIDGEVELNGKIKLLATDTEAEVKEIGFFTPEFSPRKKLSAGEIGYIATGIKEPGKIRVGDTITDSKNKFSAPPLSGYKEPKPMVFASIYPEDPKNFDLLKEALEKLKLNDPALTSEQETKEALGRGFRCGFLGTLHAEIVSARVQREFKLGLIISSPCVLYKIIEKKGREKLIYSPADWPESSEIEETQEPWVSLEILTPLQYLGKVSEILKGLEGNYISTNYLRHKNIILNYEVPLREIITNFYDKIKSATQGYASMNYKILGFRRGDLVKMGILIAGEKEEAFSKIVSQSKAFKEGKKLLKKLKETLPAQQFAVALQAVVGGKIIARETISARRKDVTGYLYGGDYSRKRKLLEKQKKGKKKLKTIGKVRVPPEVFLKVFRG